MENKNRWYHLDIFKFVGLSSLLLWHTIDWWYSDGKGFILPKENVELYTDFFQIGMSFFLFVCISLPIGAGISLRYMIDKFIINKDLQLKSESLKFIIKRSLLLIGCGFLINISSFGIEESVSWDILQMVGMVSFLIVLFLNYFKFKYLMVLSLASILCSKLITTIYHNSIGSYNSFSFKLFNNIFFGDPAGESYYAFFPWASFVVIGIYLADLYKKSQMDKINKALLLSGILFFPCFIFFRDIWTYDINNTWGPHIFMPKTLDLLGVISIFSLFFFVVNKISLEKISKYFNEKSLNPVNIFARNIMYIYVVHSIVVENVVEIFVNEYRYDTKVALVVFILQYLFAYLVGLLIHLFRYKRYFKNVDI